MGVAGVPVEIDDPRNGDRHLRVAWHAAERTVVVSQWRNGVCVATTPLDIADVPTVVNLLVGALAEASRTPPPGAGGDGEPRASWSGIGRDLLAMARSRFRPPRAPVIPLRRR